MMDNRQSWDALPRCHRFALRLGPIAFGLILGWHISVIPVCPGGDIDPRQHHLEWDKAQATPYTSLKDGARVDLLKRLHSQVEANCARIQTWSGKYRLQDTQRIEDFKTVSRMVEETVTSAALRRDEGEFTFDVDRTRNKVAVDFKVAMPKFTETTTYKALTVKTLPSPKDATQPPTAVGGEAPRYLDTRGFYQQSILNGSEFLSFEPLLVYGDFVSSKITGQHGRAAFRKPPEMGDRQEWGIIPDPGRFFCDPLGPDRELETLLSALTRGIDKEYTKEHYEAMHSAVEVLTAGEHDEFVKIRFVPKDASDGNKSSNKEMVRIYGRKASYMPLIAWQGDIGKNGTPGLITSYGYRMEKDAYIPEFVSRINSPDGKYVAFQRMLTLVESRCNEAIGEDRFTISRFGLVDGERLVDRIDGRILMLHDGEFVDAGSVPKILPRKVSNSLN